MVCPLLKMKNICKRFGNTVANQKINLEVQPSEIHAILGENGAGKTTLMNILYGLYQADSGSIEWKGKKVTFRSPKEAIDAGIGMVHQHFMLVKTFTVTQNIILGMKLEDNILINTKDARNKILELSKKYSLAVNPDAKINNLSVGVQQRVEILKALYRNAELLILDEPTAVLTPQEIEEFFHILKELKSEGHSIIIITHKISEVMEISDRITVLRDGKNVATLYTNETNPQELSRHMIGRELISNYKKVTNNIKDKHCSLKLKNLHFVDKDNTLLSNINLSINKGEIVGIAGVDGNGQKELAETIMGIRIPSSGQIFLNNVDITNYSVRQRMQLGIAYIPDDRHLDGLVLDFNVAENFMLRYYNEYPFSKRMCLNFKEINDTVNGAIKTYSIKTPDLKAKVRSLSGGNQQKIILARELASNPKVIVGCQPTRGLDIGAAETIHKLLIEMRNKGVAILLISTDLEEIISLSDRIAVMYEGKIAGIKDNKNVDLKELGLLMGGEGSRREHAL